MFTRTMKVFVSATSSDLGSCRLTVRDLLLTQGIHPVLQDHFPPDYRQLVEYLRDQISSTEAVLCLVGEVYGAAPTDGLANRSYTQLEYDIARELDIPVFVFLTDQEFQSAQKISEPTEMTHFQQQYRVALMDSHKCEFFSTPDELEKKISAAIPSLLRLNRQNGMLYLHPPPQPPFFAGRGRELTELRSAMRQRLPALIAVIGMGGQGKTTLLRQAVEELEVFPFASGFWCTAYRGGFTFDNFIDEVLKHFTGNKFDKRSMQSIEDRVSYLLVEIQKRPVLIVIDGIEHWLRGWNTGVSDLEEAETTEQRESYYPELDTLLQSIAGISNGTHLVITTRAIPAALDHVAYAMVPVRDPSVSPGLHGLEDFDAISLLREFGVLGNDEQLRSAASCYANHPLALEVLAGFLVRNEGGRIECAPELNILDPKGRLFHLLDMTKEHLPGRKDAVKTLQIVSHFIEEPSLEMVSNICFQLGLLPRGMRFIRSILPMSGRFLQTNTFSKPSAKRDLIVTLSDWNLLGWDGFRKKVKLHPLIKEFFAGGVERSRVIDTRISELYSNQQIPDFPSSLVEVRSRILAIEHALRAGDSDRCVTLLFEAITQDYIFVEWLSVWGHQTTGIDLLKRVADHCSSIQKPQLLNSCGAMCWELGRIENAMHLLNEAAQLSRRFRTKRNETSCAILASILHNRANVLCNRKEFSAAKSNLTEAIEILKDLKEVRSHHRIAFVRALTNRGNVSRDMGSLSNAIADYKDALLEFGKDDGQFIENNEVTLTQIQLNLAIAFSDRRDYKNANLQFEQCLKLFETQIESGHIEYKPVAAYAKVMFGTMLNDRGHHMQAITIIERGLSELRSFIDDGRHDLEEKYALAYLNKAQALVDAKQWQEADSNSLVAVDLFERIYRDGRDDIKGHLGHVLMIRSEALLGSRLKSEANIYRQKGLELLRGLAKLDAADAGAVYMRKLSSSAILLEKYGGDIKSVLNYLDEFLSFSEEQLSRKPPLETILLEMRRSLERIQDGLSTELIGNTLAGRCLSLHQKVVVAYNLLTHFNSQHTNNNEENA
jgi:tetratricopeptide (TPR) repeat protein